MMCWIIAVPFLATALATSFSISYVESKLAFASAPAAARRFAESAPAYSITASNKYAEITGMCCKQERIVRLYIELWYMVPAFLYSLVKNHGFVVGIDKNVVFGYTVRKSRCSTSRFQHKKKMLLQLRICNPINFLEKVRTKTHHRIEDIHELELSVC